MQKVKKSDVGWITKAPQRICSKCTHVGRYGLFNDKFNCTKYGFCTKGNAVCDDFKPKEAPQSD